MKKYNETMIIKNGKMLYAISLKDKEKNNSDRTHIIIENGEIKFTDSWFNSKSEFDFNEEAHKIAKEIFVSQLQVDIKRRVLELKQLEEIFIELDLQECFGSVLTDNTKRILELENKVAKIKKENKSMERKTAEIVNNVIEEKVRPIAIKKGKENNK